MFCIYKLLFKENDHNITAYYCPNHELSIIKPKFDLAIKGSGMANFEDFKCISKVTKSIIQKSSWKQSICTCSTFLKKYICPHIVCLSLKFELCSCPLAAKTVPLGQKRKRGRPSLAKKALQRQWCLIISQGPWFLCCIHFVSE